jgi:DNA-binding MarR family transcriptional regulator
MPNKKKDPLPGPGRFAYDRLDRIMHEKARLGILTSLMTRPEGLLFGELKQVCALTDGNLSRHLEVLHEAGLVEVRKGFENRRPQTLCCLTVLGRRRFVEYLAELERVIHDATPRHAEATEKPRATAPDMPLGWGTA